MSNRYGIDYGKGLTNVDQKTGIRYGVIAKHRVHECFWEKVLEEASAKRSDEIHDGAVEVIKRHLMQAMRELDIEIDDAILDGMAEEVVNYSAVENAISEDGEILSGTVDIEIDDVEYTVQFDETDFSIIKSPYYTHGVFCSPCAPGAVSLTAHYGMVSEDTNAPRAYCLGAHCFENDEAPYKIYRVRDLLSTTGIPHVQQETSDRKTDATSGPAPENPPTHD